MQMASMLQHVHGQMIAREYGVRLTWDIKSHAHVQWAGTTQVQASNIHKMKVMYFSSM